MNTIMIRYLELVELYLGTLVWPLVIIAALWMFQKPIATFIQNIRRGRGFGLELEAQPREGPELAELMEASLAKFREGIVEQLSERLGGREAAEQEVEHVLKNNFVAVDIGPMLGDTSERAVLIPYDPNLGFTNFLNKLWFTFPPWVEPFQYGVQWLLRFADSREVIVHQRHNQRLRTNALGRTQLRDTRNLRELAISPSRPLIAEPTVG